MKRALISSLCVVLFASVASATAPAWHMATVWLEGDAGGNTVTVVAGETASFNLWMSYEGPANDGAVHRLISMDAGLRHNGFATGNTTWDAQDGVGFQAVGLYEQGTWGDGALPMAFGDHGGYALDGALPSEEVVPGNLNGFPGTSLPYLFAAGSPSGDGAERGILSSSTSWYLDQVVIEGLVVNWDDMAMTGTPDTVNFPRKTSPAAPGYVENQLYAGVWTEDLQQKCNQGVGAPFNRMYVRVITPEPASLALLAVGGLAAIRRRR